PSATSKPRTASASSSSKKPSSRRSRRCAASSAPRRTSTSACKLPVRHTGRAAAIAIFAGIGVLGVLAIRPGADPDPVPLELSVPDIVRIEPMPVEILPDAAPPLGPAARLEQRLAALAAAVEAGRLGEVDDALVEFDVEGLAARLEKVLVAHEHTANVS